MEAAQEIDLYAAAGEEVLLFEGGISVKAQKPKRQSVTGAEVVKPDLEPTHRVFTDVSSCKLRLGNMSM